jgi:hypothetical protein
MSVMKVLPERVWRFLEAGVVAEFATVSRAGAAIDTPTYYFPSDDLSTFASATSLPNPNKVDRARRNPKVGLLMEGAPDEPVVAMRGHAAARDADLAANVVRYLAEAGWKSISHGIPWEQARKAVHYWTQVFIEVTPLRIMWWDTPAAMDGPPQVWNAPADIVLPQSDPAPTGTTASPNWPVRPWRALAAEIVAVPGMGAHLSLCDDDGYPLAFRARQVEPVDNGFRLTLPGGLPWRGTGKGTLTWAGLVTFIGEAVADGGAPLFKVERALPQNPGMTNTEYVLQPPEDLYRKRMARLEEEARRRGQAVPPVPASPPPLTRLAQLRQARLASNAPVTGMSDDRGNRRTS